MANKVLCGVTAVAWLGGSAGVALASTLTVDDDGVQCPSAQYTAIQDAIDAAVSGDTILVCAGTYDGPLAIDKRLNVRGAQAGKDGRKRAVVDASESILTGQVGDHVVILADGVILDGFLVRVPFEGSDAGVATAVTTSGWTIQNNVFDDSGLLSSSSGATLSTVRRNAFNRPFGAFPETVFSTSAHNLTIRANSFLHADLVFVDGDTIGVEENSLTGDGMFAFFRTQNLLVRGNRFQDVTKFAALLLGQTSTVQVIGNRARQVISGYWVQGNNSDVSLLDNKVEGCTGIGISLAWDGVDFARGVVLEVNEIEECNTGIRLYGADGNVIQFNDIEDNDVVGIEVQFFPIFAGAGDNFFIGNHVRGNGPPDCRDETLGTGTAGTANIWIDNEGSRSEPTGLCVDHVGP